MDNFFTKINILLNRFLAMLGLRHHEDKWGVVYDAVNKQPLDPVIVKLINAVTGRVEQNCVTDMGGRYNFLAYPGRFKILVKKSNYEFPSRISGGDHDEIYKNLYHGELFELTGDSGVIPFNIPMDPVNSDWNQTAKAKVSPFHPYAEHFLYKIISLVFWFVFILDLLSLYFSPMPFAYGLLGFYGGCFFLALVLPSPRLWGKINFKNTKSADGLVIELSYFAMPGIILAKANVTNEGKFFLRVSEGKYILSIKQYSAENQPKLLYSRKINVGSEQVINLKFTI